MKVFLDDIRRWCPDNNRLSACLLSFFERNEYRLVSDHRDADFMVINACNITRRQVGVIERCVESARERGRGRVVVIGCPPWYDRRGADADVRVLPTWKILRAPEEIDRAFDARTPFRWLKMDEVLLREGLCLPGLDDLEDYCFLKVSSGCLSHCSFCAAPQAQGPLRSEPLEKILSDAGEGLARGRRKFVLWGKDNGCWGHDLGLDLPHLLERLIELDPDCRIAVPYLNPTYLSGIFPRLLPLLENVPYLTSPIQSGSPRILKLMRRDYDLPEVYRMVDEIRRQGSTKVLTSVIVGFPTETRQDFAASTRGALHFDLVTITKLVVHPGTKAASLTLDVPESEVQARVRALEKTCAKAGIPTMYYDDVSGL